MSIKGSAMPTMPPTTMAMRALAGMVFTPVESASATANHIPVAGE